jgi:hypothetical protein
VRPGAVVVSAHASQRDRKPASLQVIAARVFKGVLGQPGRAVSPTPRDRGADETHLVGH